MVRNRRLRKKESEEEGIHLTGNFSKVNGRMNSMESSPLRTAQGGDSWDSSFESKIPYTLTSQLSVFMTKPLGELEIERKKEAVKGKLTSVFECSWGNTKG
jgi:hypothetical protein